MALGIELIQCSDFTCTTGWSTYGTSVIANDEYQASGLGEYANCITQNMSLIEGTEYEISFDIRDYISGAVLLRIGGTDGASYDTNGTHTERVICGAGGNPQFALLSWTGAPTFTGTLDNISVKEVLPTTTVEVEWVDSISVAATGNKIYRDDVEIADIANGNQFYSDPDAPAGTESKYEVQAHDGAGDETTQEVEGENMDYITTA